MLSVGGRPLLAHTLEHLTRCGFTRVAINLHFEPHAIPEHFGDGGAHGLQLHYSHEPELMGTAGALTRLEPWLSGDEPFLVLYGDILTDQDLGALMASHRERGAAATLVLHQRIGSNSLVCMNQDQRIIGFLERPTDAERAEHPYAWVNSGIQVLQPHLLEHLPRGRACDLPRDLYMPWLQRERFYGVPLTGFRVAIDSPERYRLADAAVRDGTVFAR